jgi:hypothetical protein
MKHLTKTTQALALAGAVILTSAATVLAVECYGNYFPLSCDGSGSQTVTCSLSCEVSNGDCQSYSLTAVDGDCGRQCLVSETETYQGCEDASPKPVRTKTSLSGEPICTPPEGGGICNGSCANVQTTVDENFTVDWVELPTENCDPNPYE